VAGLLVACLFGWLVGLLLACLVGWGCLLFWLAGFLFACLFGWLVCWLLACLVACLVLPSVREPPATGGSPVAQLPMLRYF
jgi:hypothetical protein